MTPQGHKNSNNIEDLGDIINMPDVCICLIVCV